MSFHQLWTAYPFISRMLTAITVGTGALVGVAQAWPYVEPWLAAHRAYVRDYTEEESAKLRRTFEPTRVGMYDVQISIARSRRSAINDRLITLELDAPKSETAAELVARRQQIEKLKEERDDLDAEIKALRVQRDKS
jgi:hypothetical protein